MARAPESGCIRRSARLKMAGVKAGMTSVTAVLSTVDQDRRITIPRFQFGPLGTAIEQQNHTCVECKPRSRPVRSKNAVHAGAGTSCRTAASNVAGRRFSQGRLGSVRLSRSSGDDPDPGAIGVDIMSARLSRQPPHCRRTVGRRRADAVMHPRHPALHERPLVRAGIKSHYGGPRMMTTFKGLPISTPEQAFLDLASVGAELVDLVIVADGLIKQERTTTAQLTAAAVSWQGRGRSLAVRAAGLARAGVDSVQETRVRLLVVLAGLPEPKVNVIKRAQDGEWRRRYDMAYLEWKTLLEYDGRQHADDPKQWRSDIYRREELDRMGWRLIVVTSDGIFREPGRTLERILIALQDAGATKLPKQFRPEWEHHFPTR